MNKLMTTLMLLSLSSLAVATMPVKRSLVDDSGSHLNPRTPANPENSSIMSQLQYHTRCQSSSRCFYSTMPFYNQSSPYLATYVGDQVYFDRNIEGHNSQGLSAPTSAAMLLQAVLDEKHPVTLLNNDFLQGYKNRVWYKNVYEIAKKAHTQFRIKDFTWNTMIYKAFRSYFNSTRAAKNLKWYKDGLLFKGSDITNSELINEIKKNKYGFLIGVSRHVHKTAKVLGHQISWYSREGEHSMVIKGFDGDRLHIQDPWGMDYFAVIDRRVFPTTAMNIVHSHSVFIPVNFSSQGWMGSRYREGNRLVLDELIGISLD